jgi:hypothetical protein
MSEYESAAMWQLHAPAGQAIALQSTFARLKAVLPPEASLGVVKYVDYDTVAIPEANLFWAFLHKRQSFEHEAELRAIILDPLFHDDTPPRVNLENPGQGRRVAVNLKELVQRVVVSPTCPDDWYYELVARVTERLGSHFPVDRSSLDDQPIF